MKTKSMKNVLYETISFTDKSTSTSLTQNLKQEITMTVIILKNKPTNKQKTHTMYLNLTSLGWKERLAEGFTKTAFSQAPTKQTPVHVVLDKTQKCQMDTFC